MENIKVVVTLNKDVISAFEDLTSSLETISKKDGFDKEEFSETLDNFTKAVYAAFNTTNIVTCEDK